MACNIERPDPNALFDKYKNMFQNTVLGGAAIIEESNEWYAVAVNYAMAEQFYAISEQAWKEQDPRQACCDNLVAMAARDGVYPLPAQPAQGYLKLTGAPGTPLPSPLEFTVGGRSYVTAYTEGQPSALNSGGSTIVRVRAVVPGEAGNIAEATGTLDTVVPGVDTDVEVCGNTFCNGSDSESCEAFRQRYLRRLRYQPRATMAWITDKLLEWPCATRAILRAGSCCLCECGSEGCDEGCEDCGCVECASRMNFYLMFDDSFEHGIAPESVLAEVEEWLFGDPQGYGLGQVEIGVTGGIVPVRPVLTNAYVDINDCVSTSELSQIQELVQEFFQTLEPSKPVYTSGLAASIERVLGLTDVDVRLELDNPDQGYGPAAPKTEDSVVYETPCAFEPDCDYMLVLNNVVITSSTQQQGGCP